MVNIDALRLRVIGMFREPEQTMREHVNPVPPFSVVLQQHVLPIVVAGGVCMVILLMLFPPTQDGRPVPVGFAGVATQFVLHVGGTLLGLAVMAGVSAFLAQMFGGSGNYDAAFTALSLAWTPWFLAEAVLYLPVLGGLLGFAALIYSFVLMYRTVPIAQNLPAANRGKHLALFMLASLLLSLVLASIVTSLLGGAATGA